MGVSARSRRTAAVITVSAFLFLLSGCPGLFSSFGPLPIEHTATMLILSWDNLEAGLEGTPSSVDHYDLFYRPLGMVSWVYVQSTPDAACTVSISQSRVGYGKFEFAVQTVYRSGRKSELHTSTDFSAWPPGGWYVDWHE